ncbi:hypothetical protein EZV73_01630 [Acidaminobacter sp. JC074]|uniref:hypothetical protein n=1 Tax=Acidaminobacter sp. JC074 TaxID=2530199 RepID=UPI001F0DB1EC|nr:hypothetical protein [Acidaminobacter sp. JC074]MCH4886245.1 hypothetical protein [Acidaminobacter sp. JC074]
MLNSFLFYYIIAFLGFILCAYIIFNKRLHTLFKILGVLIVIGLMTYPLFTHRLFNLTKEEITHIHVFDGNTGLSLEIEDRDDIEYLVEELNASVSKIDSLAMFRMGYSFRISIYSGEKLKREFILNNPNTIRDLGFFWSVKKNPIDYSYIGKLYQEVYDDYRE